MSSDIGDIAGAEAVGCAEGNMCGLVMREERGGQCGPAKLAFPMRSGLIRFRKNQSNRDHFDDLCFHAAVERGDPCKRSIASPRRPTGPAAGWL